MSVFFDRDVAARVNRLELDFNRAGYDRYGISKKQLTSLMSLGALLYRKYFRVRAFGTENIPARGRGMIVANHSGGIALDGAMVVMSCLLELEPPRLAQGMAEKFLARWPLASLMLSRSGQLTGLPENAIRLLNDERLLMVFPEGAKGTAKLYWERDSLVHFGTGFMRLALEARAPIIPTAFIGGGEAIPTIMNLEGLGRLIGAPYVPVTPYVLPLPLPAPCQIYYGTPMHFRGTGAEDDETVEAMVAEVRQAVRALIAQGRARRDAGDVSPLPPAAAPEVQNDAESAR